MVKDARVKKAKMGHKKGEQGCHCFRMIIIGPTGKRRRGDIVYCNKHGG